MGWRNMFIEISKTPIERIEEFVNHHNNWTQFFTEEEVKKMWDDDEIPGEDLSLKVLIRKTKKGDEYWAYLGNHGGSGWTIKWAEKYFDDITIYTSYDYKHYDDGWESWELLKVDEFKKIVN